MGNGTGGGLAERFIGKSLSGEVEKRVQTLKDTLVPKIDSLIEEQEKTNALLDDILKEMRYHHRIKK